MTAVFANLFGLLFAILASGVGIGIALAVTAMLLGVGLLSTQYVPVGNPVLA